MKESLVDEMIKKAAEKVLTGEQALKPTPKKAVPATEEEEINPQIYDQVLKPIREGDIIKGTVVHIDKEEVLISIGTKSEGVIPIEELSWKRISSPDKVVSIGDEIDVYVLKTGDETVLSKKQADRERSWLRIKEAYENQGVIEGVCLRTTQGGLILDLSGVRGFVPTTQIDRGNKIQPLSKYENKTIRVKILKYDKEGNNVVASRRAVLEEEDKQRKQKFLNSLFEGEMLSGKVVKIAGFGAFVDLGGIVGVAHLSELSWRRIKHPSDIVKVGDKIRVKVLNIDKERKRITLSLRQTQTDPWVEASEQFKTGTVVMGTVTKITPTYAFVELAEGVEGLLPISEMAEKKVSDPSDIISEGEKVKVKVINIDLPTRRISLSIKAALREERVEEMRSYLKSDESTTVTLGELINIKGGLQ